MGTDMPSTCRGSHPVKNIPSRILAVLGRKTNKCACSAIQHIMREGTSTHKIVISVSRGGHMLPP